MTTENLDRLAREVFGPNAAVYETARREWRAHDAGPALHSRRGDITAPTRAALERWLGVIAESEACK
jgi:hypothetical protein